MERAYGDAILLPNLYPTCDPIEKCWHGGPIKIGAFGAVRPEKNFMTAAAAAVAIQAQLGVPVELHMSTGGEGDQGLTAPAIDQMCEGKVKVIRHPWMFWDNFIQLIAAMDLLIQVSYTESFNMVTADGISVGVPSVVSPAIYWAPPSWKAEPDNALDVADTGVRLLTNSETRSEGIEYLRAHNEDSLKYWDRFLLGERSWLARLFGS
jgi:glycosyltransferase involved in cell wall biosynthesis